MGMLGRRSSSCCPPILFLFEEERAGSTWGRELHLTSDEGVAGVLAAPAPGRVGVPAVVRNIFLIGAEVETGVC